MQPCRIIYYSLAALHVSSDIFAHHQEHLNCITASGITHVCHCQLVSWECWNQFQHSHDTSRQQHMCVIPEAVIQFRYFCVFFLFLFCFLFVCLFCLFVCFLLWRCDPMRVMASSFLGFSRSHTTTHHNR